VSIWWNLSKEVLAWVPKMMYEDTDKHLNRSVSNRRMRPERVPETTQHTKETRMKVNITGIGIE
jgi:hypothetical protein